MAKRIAYSAEAGQPSRQPDLPRHRTFRFSVEDAALAAAVGRTTVFMELRSGRLKGRKIGRRTVIPLDDLNNWLASLPRIRPSGSKEDADHG